MFTLYGQTGDTSELRLERSLDRASTVAVEHEGVWLGPLTKLRVGIDGSGLGSSWFLDKIKVYDHKVNKEYYFLW